MLTALAWIGNVFILWSVIALNQKKVYGTALAMGIGNLCYVGYGAMLGDMPIMWLNALLLVINAKTVLSK